MLVKSVSIKEYTIELKEHFNGSWYVKISHDGVGVYYSEPYIRLDVALDLFSAKLNDKLELM